MVVIVMGVSGAGKTTVGAALAQALGWEFLDADEFHPPENVSKMAAAIPLTDADRWPWLERLNVELRVRESRGQGVVLACSALKEAYRARLTAEIAETRLVHLSGSIEFIRARVATRMHKYMPAALLESQFATLERPGNALEVDAGLSVPETIETIRSALSMKGPARKP
jgi:gluconokinase